MEDLEQLETWVEGMLDNLSTAERKRVAQRISVHLRKRNADRIASQVDPDGAAFAARRPDTYRPSFKHSAAVRARIMKRRIARKMFVRLRRSSVLKARWTPDQAEIGFGGGAIGRMAAVHHHGLRDRVYRDGRAIEARYPERRLLGLPDGDRDAVLDVVLRWLEEDA